MLVCVLLVGCGVYQTEPKVEITHVLAVTSEGDNNQRSVVFDIEITEEGGSDSDSNSGADSGSSSSGSTEEDSSALPSVSFMTTFILVGIAALSRSKND